MDTLNRYRKAIEDILEDYASIPYAVGEIWTEPVFDRGRPKAASSSRRDARWERRAGGTPALPARPCRAWTPQRSVPDKLSFRVADWRGMPP